MPEVPGFSGLPLWRRLRALGLASLQSALHARPQSGTVRAVPDFVRQLFSPLRVAPWTRRFRRPLAAPVATRVSAS
jgi:hypothetical protein